MKNQFRKKLLPKYWRISERQGWW